MDDHGHGTHVAGNNLGALGNNGLGVVGVNWAGENHRVKFLSSSGSGSLANAVKGLNYLVKLTTKYNVKIRLSNNSWGGGGYSQALHDCDFDPQ
jgi:subtilisin family serine protease